MATVHVVRCDVTTNALFCQGCILYCRAIYCNMTNALLNGLPDVNDLMILKTSCLLAGRELGQLGASKSGLACHITRRMTPVVLSIWDPRKAMGIALFLRRSEGPNRPPIPSTHLKWCTGMKRWESKSKTFFGSNKNEAKFNHLTPPKRSQCVYKNYTSIDPR